MPMHTRTVLLEVASLKRSNGFKNGAENKQQESTTPAQTQLKISSENMKHHAPGIRYKPAFKTVNQAEFELTVSQESAGNEQKSSSKSAQKAPSTSLASMISVPRNLQSLKLIFERILSHVFSGQKDCCFDE